MEYLKLELCLLNKESKMNWQKELRRLEQNKQWDKAIEFMEDTIAHEPGSLDAYLSMAYLLMNLLVEEDFDTNQIDRYIYLAKKYYDQSYQKFSHDPKYLFYMGKTMAILEWLLDKDTPDYVTMLKEALRLEPNNLLYQWNHYGSLDRENPENRKKICEYAKKVLALDSPIPKILNLESSLGEYLFEILTNWSKDVLKFGGMPE
jgi:tetratricopeptide (TPR) repeat protein